MLGFFLCVLLYICLHWILPHILFQSHEVLLQFLSAGLQPLSLHFVSFSSLFINLLNNKGSQPGPLRTLWFLSVAKKCQLTHFLGFYSAINFYLNEDFPSCALRPVFIFNYQLKHSKTTKKKTNYIWWVILSFNKVLIHIIRSTLLTIKLCFFFFQNGSSSWLHRVGRDLKDHLLSTPFPCVGTLFIKS